SGRQFHRLDQPGGRVADRPGLPGADVAAGCGFADSRRARARCAGVVAIDGDQVGAEPDCVADAAAGRAVVGEPHVALDGPAADADGAIARPHSPPVAAHRGHRLFAADIADSGASGVDDAGAPDLRLAGSVGLQGVQYGCTAVWTQVPGALRKPDTCGAA